ncbi:hypothetical protein DENSPDRAFT_928778 [Dentipellis sp. KUC8613]|nr:hypothetical protein DENSPDRAFT_928778 [Dentipellis sp. KUC8613]
MSFDASTPSLLLRSPKPQLAAFDDGAASITRKFDAVLSSTTQRAANYEQQIKELEDKLSEDLSNCRAIEGLLRDAYNALKRNSRRADKEALRGYVPHIDEQLAESMEVLSRLEKTLPAVQAQTVHIHATYDSGWEKAKELVHDLEWLNTDFYERWRTIVFTTASPVSERWKLLVRVLFLVCFSLTAWVVWITLRGAYRAHRQRLVWGERLMS